MKIRGIETYWSDGSKVFVGCVSADPRLPFFGPIAVSEWGIVVGTAFKIGPFVFGIAIPRTLLERVK